MAGRIGSYEWMPHLSMNATTLTTTHPAQLLRLLHATAFFVVIAMVLTTVRAQETAGSIKVGIIGLDAHAVSWTQIIHHKEAKPPISDMRIVAAVAVPSPDVPFSQDNIEKNITTMR